LTGFARALDFKGEDELHRVACNDGAEFTRRYVKGKSPSHVHNTQGHLARESGGLALPEPVVWAIAGKAETPSAVTTARTINPLWALD
jgi:hypothetical protein